MSHLFDELKTIADMRYADAVARQNELSKPSSKCSQCAKKNRHIKLQKKEITDLRTKLNDKNQYELFLLDLAGYLVWATHNEQSPVDISLNLVHDVMGTVRKELCFVPRTSGYAKYWFRPELLKQKTV